jgi:hypothetical protein
MTAAMTTAMTTRMSGLRARSQRALTSRRYGCGETDIGDIRKAVTQ